jgi:carboxylesterase
LGVFLLRFKALIKGSEPFFMPGSGANGRVGCLLIHGFTGTPFEMLGLGEALAAEGYTVLGPRLAHHGTSAADMNRSRWWDWYYAALDGYHLLQAMCDQVAVIGLSMGGVIALTLAANNPVVGVVGMSTPAIYMENETRMKLARLFWWLKPLLGKPAEEKDGGWPSYKQYPVRAAGELMVYRRQLAHVLPLVTAPALLIHAADDKTVPSENLAYIYEQINSAEKNRIIFETGGHVITEGAAKQRVYQEVIAFLNRLGA